MTIGYNICDSDKEMVDVIMDLGILRYKQQRIFTSNEIIKNACREERLLDKIEDILIKEGHDIDGKKVC